MKLLSMRMKMKMKKMKKKMIQFKKELSQKMPLEINYSIVVKNKKEIIVRK